MLLDVTADGVLEVCDGFEDAAPDSPAGDDGEEAFDGVEPRGRCGCEMEDPARMIRQPFPDLRVLMGGVVVGDGVDDLARRNRPLDRVEELDEFQVGVLGHAAADHGAVEDVEGGEQGGGAVALVVVGHGAALAGFQRQTGLGAIKGLDLALLINGHDDSVGGRVHVEADDILDLGGEGRVLGLLEGAEPVRLQAVRVPDSLYGAKGNANGLGHCPAGPVGDFPRWLGAGQRHHLGDGVGGQWCLAGFAAGLPQKDINPMLGETALPAPHGWAADAGLPRDLMHRQSFCRKHHDPGALNLLEGAIAITDDGG